MDDAVDLSNEKQAIMTKTELSVLDRFSGLVIINHAIKRTCLIHANNDFEAVAVWLKEYATSQSTLKAYQKEAERFFIWCHEVLNKSFSQLKREDFDAYADFLKDPQPREKWCGPKGGKYNKRGTAQWKPFVGPLSQNARSTALTILHSLLNFLVEVRYLDINPMPLRAIKRRQQQHERVLSVQERILEPEEWQSMLNCLHQLPEDNMKQCREKERLKIVIYLMFFLGLRIGELCRSTWNAFRKVQGRWWFFIIGKGNKPGKIPVNAELLQYVQAYRIFLGVSPLPTPDDITPIVISFRSRSPCALGSRQLYEIIKKLTIETSNYYVDQPEIQKKLLRFSPHWLRHLSASMQDQVGIAFKHIRENHRHESDETTRLYIHANDVQRHNDMEKLSIDHKSNS